ncbi:1,3-beta-glucan synthase component-domain-containing protein [Lentinula edodes]|nr:1,3-beta-glucan synthase component-domain-containing protein [Lentinula edodes]
MLAGGGRKAQEQQQLGPQANGHSESLDPPSTSSPTNGAQPLANGYVPSSSPTPQPSECLKIGNNFGEFEECAVSSQSPYAQWGHRDFKTAPVAIVGAREYIFSENIGILGDLAGKEQTFGPLFARSVAWVGGKLHYGHPDFLNALYMKTRGGVSKAQKGLHLNEDIYAGMNTFGRGGRIKHTDSNLTFGGARYIATGRGFATSRITFNILYSRLAGPSIFLGMRTLIMLPYVTLSLWTPWIIYFWFVFSDFVIDYRQFLRWMSRGNSHSHINSWIGYCRLSRTMITGYKKKKLGHPSEKLSGDVPCATWRAVLFCEVVFPIVVTILFIIAYMFVKSFPVNGTQPPSPLIRIAVISLGPIVWNAAVLLTLFLVSLFLGPMLDPLFPMLDLNDWILRVPVVPRTLDVSHAVHGLTTVIAIQRAVHKVLIAVFFHENSSTTKRIAPGGLEDDMGEGLEPTLCLSPLVNMWSRLSNFAYGAQI